ncbi:MAG: formate dehydrogenase accessory sulfurtransferase FdhD [Verrucomicrobiota bacterium]
MSKLSNRTSIQVIKQHVVGAEAQAPQEDYLAIEDPLEITLVYERNGGTIEKKLIVTLRTPGHDEEMIHGFLYCEGLIRNAADITQIYLRGNNDHAAPTHAHVHLRPGLEVSSKTTERNLAAHSSCGVCGTTSIGHLEIPKALEIDDAVTIPAGRLHDFPDQMRAEQETFGRTGGLHAAAIFTADGSLQVSREDIGRHNALDKAIGANLISGLTPAQGQALCVSGRMSYEIIQKALLARIPIICGIGAPSSLAVALANDFNITLIGFLRNGSYNIYSCPERIETL